MGEVDHFEAFGRAAEVLTDPTIVAGRYSFQRAEEGLIAADVAHKLRLTSSDHVLEIGCGVGGLLRSLAPQVAWVFGVDHPSCISALERAGIPSNATLVAGRWPEVRLNSRFNKVLAYSVLHYLPDASSAFAFIDECISVLEAGGWLMLGDLPNVDCRRRFQSTEFGERFARDWARKAKEEYTNEDRSRDEMLSSTPSPTPYLTDDFLASLFLRYRQAGHDVYVVPQAAGLPFCHTREDVLISIRQ